MSDLVMQTRDAMDFMDSLYREVAALFREAQELIEKRDWTICRPSGYNVIFSERSTGLDPGNVPFWNTTSFTVAFGPAADTKRTATTATMPRNGLVLLILRIEIKGPGVEAPRVVAGVLRDIKLPGGEKFEKVLAPTFAKNALKVFEPFKPIDRVNYVSSTISFSGRFFEVPLFEIIDRHVLQQKVVDPLLALAV